MDAASPQVQFYCFRERIRRDVPFGQQVRIKPNSVKFVRGHLTRFTVTLTPKSGPYRGGRFDFTIWLQKDFPASPLDIRCNTPIYHPGIRNESGLISLSGVSGRRFLSLEFVVEKVLGMLYTPMASLDNAISLQYEYGGRNTKEDLEEKVARTLRGGSHFGIEFPRNLGHDRDHERRASVRGPGDVGRSSFRFTFAKR